MFLWLRLQAVCKIWSFEFSIFFFSLADHEDRVGTSPYHLLGCKFYSEKQAFEFSGVLKAGDNASGEITFVVLKIYLTLIYLKMSLSSVHEDLVYHLLHKHSRCRMASVSFVVLRMN